MWKRSSLSLLLAGALSLGFATAGRQQTPCPEPADVRNCACGTAEGFTTVKAFPVNLAQSQEYSYVFTQGAEYLLTLCGPEGQPLPLKVSVLDGYRNPLFDNYDKKGRQYRRQMGYVCGQTSVAVLKLEPAKGAQGCGYVFVSFKAL